MTVVSRLQQARACPKSTTRPAFQVDVSVLLTGAEFKKSHQTLGVLIPVPFNLHSNGICLAHCLMGII